MPEQIMTCGQGLAEHSALHEKLSNLLATVASNLQLHLASLDPSDKTSRPEYDAYTALVRQHSELAARHRAAAEQMASYHDLPMANHDAEVLGGEPVMSAFRQLITDQEQLVDLLREWIERDRALLDDSSSTVDPV